MIFSTMFLSSRTSLDQDFVIVCLGFVCFVIVPVLSQHMKTFSDLSYFCVFDYMFALLLLLFNQKKNRPFFMKTNSDLSGRCQVLS